METTTRKTQNDVVREKLERDGFVTNFWAIQNNILRLGAVVHDLRHRSGMDIVSRMGGEMPWIPESDRKNCYYMTRSTYDEWIAREQRHVAG